MITKKPTYAWYAIYTRARHEKKIANILQEENIEYYLPLRRSLKQWSDRKKWIQEPLFSCYIFVKISHIEFYNVLIVPGVMCYVSFGGVPQTIPDNQIERLKLFVSERSTEIVLTRDQIEKGVKAEVVFGALKGMQGEIVQIYGQSRFLIRVDSLGCSLYANISKEEVRVLQPEVRLERRC